MNGINAKRRMTMAKKRRTKTMMATAKTLKQFSKAKLAARKKRDKIAFA